VQFSLGNQLQLDKHKEAVAFKYEEVIVNPIKFFPKELDEGIIL